MKQIKNIINWELIKKFRRVENNDTVSIKQINSLINKITEDNYINIIKEILPLLKPHYLSYVIENIVKKVYGIIFMIHLYVKLLNDINNQNDIRILLNRELNSSYKKLIENNITGNTYEDLCNKNNKLDKLSGLSILISNLEKNISIENNTDIIIMIY